MRVLWLDDDSFTDEYRFLRELLERAASSVELDSADSLPTLLSCVDETHFFHELLKADWDLVVIDYKIPNTTGVEVARKVLASYGNIRIVFLSGWVVQFDPAFRLDPRAQYRALQKPDESEDLEMWYNQKLLPTIGALFESPLISYELSDVESNRVSSPELANRATFDLLDFESQLDVIDYALVSVESLTESLFEQTNVGWVIFSWPSMIIGFWGDVDSDVSETAISQFEAMHDEISVRAGRHLEVGEVGSTWSDCRDLPQAIGKAGGVRDSYPSLAIELEGWRSLVNVDTGSVCSFIAMSELVDSGLEHLLPARTRQNWQRESLRLGPEGRRERITVAILDRNVDVAAREGTVSIRLRARVVDGFYRTGLARVCRAGKCFGSTLRGDGLLWCGHRKGLLGRDILRLNSLRLVFDSIRRFTYVETEQPGHSMPSLAESPSALGPKGGFLYFGSDDE